ncbi:selenoprotein W-related protein, partial [Biomphalaria glabrata]
SFEIKINNELVFSKLKLGGFPKAEDVIDSIRAAQKGEAKLITESHSPGCSIL